MVATYEQLEDFFQQLGDDIPRPWRDHYPEAVPTDIDKQGINTLVDLMGVVCKEHAARPAFSFMGQVMSYKKLDQLTQRFSNYLRDTLQVSAPGRIGMMLPNCFHFPVVLFGAMRAGLTVVPINPLSTAKELEVLLADAQLDAILVLENCADVVERAALKVPVKHIMVARIGDFFGPVKGQLIYWFMRHVKKIIPNYDLPTAVLFKDILKNKDSYKSDSPEIQPHDLALIQYTGGTSGRPKGVMLTHANLVANATQNCTLLAPKLGGIQPVVLGALPFYHVYALMVCCISFFKMGAKCVLVADPRNQSDLIKILKKEKLTIFVGINTLCASLLSQPAFAEVDCSSWRITVTGGMATQAHINTAWRQRTNTEVMQGYGLSEASPVVSVNLRQEKKYLQSIGLPLPSTDVCIIKVDGIGLCDFNEPGELCVRGPQVMAGYWRNPEKTSMIKLHGWLLTSDIAKMDEGGNLFLVDRKKDMVIVSGFNVYPAEVEKTLLNCVLVQDVAVIGVEDEKTGEALKAFVVSTKKHKPSAEKIIEYCRDHLVPYKVPKEVVFIDCIPKSSIGKILRRKLRDDPSA